MSDQAFAVAISDQNRAYFENAGEEAMRADLMLKGSTGKRLTYRRTGEAA